MPIQPGSDPVNLYQFTTIAYQARGEIAGRAPQKLKMNRAADARCCRGHRRVDRGPPIRGAPNRFQGSQGAIEPVAASLAASAQCAPSAPGEAPMAIRTQPSIIGI